MKPKIYPSGTIVIPQHKLISTVTAVGSGDFMRYFCGHVPHSTQKKDRCVHCGKKVVYDPEINEKLMVWRDYDGDLVLAKRER